MGIGKIVCGVGFFVSSFTTAYFVQDYMNIQRQNAEIQNKPEMVQSRKYEDDLNYLAVGAQPLYESEDILSETDEMELYLIEEEFDRVSLERKEFRGDNKIAGLETTIKANQRRMDNNTKKIGLSAIGMFIFGGLLYNPIKKL